MVGIVVTNALRKSLPEHQRANVEDALWSKSGGLCFLCGGTMNRAADMLEIDHDLPSSEGGEHDLNNLNVVHRRCNRFKRNHPSVNVRPYLQFEAYVEARGGDVKYDGALGHFGVQPKPSVVTRDKESVRFEFPDGSMRESPIFLDATANRQFLYTFVDVPRSAIYNDNDCQPRTIKLTHLWSILADLQLNPLHEPPACRIATLESSSPQPLLMFDGQHKSVAYWLKGNDRIISKVYLGMNTKDAIVLVNSIQSKIKKLPLSPFEFNAKLSDEWDNKLAEYESYATSEEASEAGFLNWITDPAERKRAKEAFKAAQIDGVVSDPTLDLRNYILKPSARRDASGIPEATVKGKVIEQLLHLNPLKEKGDQMRQLREREVRNVVRVLNLFTQMAFEAGPNPSPQAEERTRRLMYQASLQYSAAMLKKLVAHVLSEDAVDRVFLEREPDPTQWDKIEAGIQRYVDHPIWTIDFNHSARTAAVQNALAKNQEVDAAFRGVNLRLGYVTGVDVVSTTDL